MDTLIISIVTPSFNQEKYLEDTVLSVITQEGNFFLDYIIMDGASSDNSIKIIKKYANVICKECQTIENRNGINFHIPKNNTKSLIKCKGISYRWFSKKDNGQADAINNGFSISKGSILAWLNSDDYYLNEKVLNIISKNINLNNPEILYGRGWCVNEEKEIIRDFHDNCNTMDFDENILKWECFILQPSVFITRKAYTICGSLNEKLNWCLDWEYWLRASNHGIKFSFLPVFLSCWRIHELIKSNVFTKKYFKEKFSITKMYSRNVFDYWKNVMISFSAYPGYLDFYFSIMFASEKQLNLLLKFIIRIIIKLFLLLINNNRSKSKKFIRIAVFTPLPPLKTGIAHYSRKLIENLANDNNLFIDVYICDNYNPEITLNNKNIRVMNHSLFKYQYYRYENILYCYGNNYEFHGYMDKYIVKYPGVLELHDAAFFSSIKNKENKFKQKIDTFKNSNYSRLPFSTTLFKVFHSLIFIFSSYENIFIFFVLFFNSMKKNFVNEYRYYISHYFKNTKIIRKSKMIIIRDSQFIDIYGFNRKKTRIVPLAIEINPINYNINVLRKKYSFNKYNIIISSAGIIHQNKRIDKVIDALYLIVNKYRIKSILYVLIGESRWEGENIQNLIRRKKLERNIIVTGWVNNTKWNNYIEMSDFGIVLRGNSAGEHSAVLLSYFERGKPVIISDYDQYRYFPDDFTCKIMQNENEVELIAQAIMECIKTKNTKNGIMARNYVVENHCFSNLIGRYKAILLNVNSF